MSTAGFTILHFAFLAAASIRSVQCMVNDHGFADDDVTTAGAIAVVAATNVVIIVVIVVVVGVIVLTGGDGARALSFLFL